MYGAIIGDMVGSPYEFDQGRKVKDFGYIYADLYNYIDVHTRRNKNRAKADKTRAKMQKEMQKERKKETQNRGGIETCQIQEKNRPLESVFRRKTVIPVPEKKV